MEFNKSKINKKQNLIYNLKSNNQFLVGSYIGIWCGDGTQYYDKGYRIKICCHKKNKSMIRFFRFILSELFGKTVTHVAKERKNNRCFLRFNSKFIYGFINEYVIFDTNKTYSVCLKEDIETYRKEFLEGFILGLSLTDGYLKNRYYLNTTSKKLAENVMAILKKWKFSPKLYIHNRAKYNWKDLNMVRLNKKESLKLLKKMDLIIKQMRYNDNFLNLKYEGKYGSAETFKAKL